MQPVVLRFLLSTTLVLAGAITAVAANVVTLRFVGDLQGIRADAVVAFEPLPDYVRAAGLIPNLNYAQSELSEWRSPSVDDSQN